MITPEKRKTRVAWLSVFSNSCLVAGKIVVGLMIGSVSVISEAIHSGVDLLAAIIALFAVKTAVIPADKEHPFGHGKVENISGTIEALLIFVAAAWIIYEAVHKLIAPKPLEAASWGVAVMLISAIVNIVVSHFLFKVGRETGSVALLADAWHLRTDVYTSVGVTLALAAIWMHEVLAPDWNVHWIDPLAAIFVAVLILRAAYRLTLQSGRDLLDSRLPAEEEACIHECITRFQPAVKGYHRLSTRRSGPFRFVEFHVIVEGDMSVSESHRIADSMSESIRERFPKANVMVHIEPCDGNCKPQCEEGCLLSEGEREARQEMYGNRDRGDP